MTPSVEHYFNWLRGEKRPEPWHDYRYAVSLDFLDKNTAHKRVLEFGDESTFTKLARYAWPNAVVDCTGCNEDVRTFKTEQRYDTVVIMEVIEHVHDVPTADYDKRARWVASGQLAMLHNAVACLEPGGKLFVTTPNAAGYGVIWRALVGQPPRTYEPHVRELTMPELQRLIAATGMQVETSGQWTVWQHHGLTEEQIERVKKVLVEHTHIKVERGDILYHLSRKV